jgi:hypothetical protein
MHDARVQTLMPQKMVITRAKGHAPVEDVLALRDAALTLDEKRGFITVGVAGKTTVWKGLSTEDTYKWHDALLSALTECAPARPPLLSNAAPGTSRHCRLVLRCKVAALAKCRRFC